MGMQVRTTFVLSAAATLLFVFGSASAAEPTPTATAAASHPAPSKEDREKMAQLHDKMATCLRSDKSIQDCRKDMATQCRETLGEDKCSMIAHSGHMGHDQMHKDMSTTTPAKP